MRSLRVGLSTIITVLAVMCATLVATSMPAQAETHLIEDRAAFDAALPRLAVEDFETATVDGTVEACGPVVSQETPTNCFSAGGLQPGVAYLTDGYPDTTAGGISATSGSNPGVPSKMVTGAGEIIIGFNQPVDTFGLDLGVEPLGTVCNIRLYYVDGQGPDQFPIDCGKGPTEPRFLGFTSDRLIRGILIDPLGPEANPYVDNVRFGLRAPNDFTVTGVRKHRASGSATLVVQVAGAGVTSARGKGVVVTQARSRTEQTVKLAVEPTVALWRKLNRTGKATVTLRVTFSPTGGVPKTTEKTITLVKTRR